jgi:membrane-associated protein
MLDAESIIRTAGYLGIFTVIFTESGLFFGFFLPGDSLLFTAGFFAAQGIFGLDLLPLLAGCWIAAVAGDAVGYNFGRHVGPRLFRRQESLLFSPDHIKRAQAFYARHGRKTIVLARFVPVVRTFAPIVAGVGGMPYRQFALFNVLGGLLWTIGFVSLGFALGNIPGMERYVHLTVLAIVVLSISPAAWHVWRSRSKRKSHTPDR